MAPRRSRPRQRSLVIAIDGPAGSGKSTIAKGVAKSLGLRRLDTGAMYRALTLAAVRAGIDPGDSRRLGALARRTRFSFRDSEVLMNGKPVGPAIRRPEVSSVVSKVAAHPGVRRELVKRQREIIGKGGVVVEGRDIGTVVVPGAELKVFLTASPGERARRRHLELTDAGVKVSLPKLRKEQARRDRLDSTRSVSPLKAAKDAVKIDSTGKTPRQTVAEVVRLVRNLEAAAPKPAPRRRPRAGSRSR